jgi:hypothetical protein
VEGHGFEGRQGETPYLIMQMVDGTAAAQRLPCFSCTQGTEHPIAMTFT